MVRTSKELGRGRREKGRRRACAPRPSVFLPCLISFLPLLVSRIGALFSVCSSVAQRVIFVGAFLSWLWSFRQEGPRLQMWAGQGVGNRAAHCTGRTGGARGAIRSSILPSQNQAVCCHTHTHHFCLNLFSVFLLQRSAKGFKVMQINRSASSRSWKVFELRKLHWKSGKVWSLVFSGSFFTSSAIETPMSGNEKLEKASIFYIIDGLFFFCVFCFNLSHVSTFTNFKHRSHFTFSLYSLNCTSSLPLFLLHSLCGAEWC